MHGFSVSGFIFDDWIGPLSDAGYRVIVPDMFGHGYSERIGAAHTKEIYVEQVATLLDALKVTQPVHIVGSSMGGSITTSFAARHPARVKSVTLVAPAGLYETKSEGVWLTSPVVGDWLSRVLGPYALEYVFAATAARAPDPAAAGPSFGSERIFAVMRRGCSICCATTMCCRKPATTTRSAGPVLPVLAVWGTADTVIPFAQSEALRRRVPQTVLAPLEDMPHGTPLIAPAATMAPIMPFLAATEAR